MVCSPSIHLLIRLYHILCLCAISYSTFGEWRVVFRLGKKTTTGSAGDKKADEKALGVDAQGPFLFSRSWAVMQKQELFYCIGKTKAPSLCLATALNLRSKRTAEAAADSVWAQRGTSKVKQNQPERRAKRITCMRER